jgi:hypothetical protein
MEYKESAMRGRLEIVPSLPWLVPTKKNPAAIPGAGRNFPYCISPLTGDAAGAQERFSSAVAIG